MPDEQLDTRPIESYGIVEEPIDEIRKTVAEWTIKLFGGQLVIVLIIVIGASVVDWFRFSRFFDLVQSGHTTMEFVESVPRIMTPEVMMALIAGTVAQAGAAFYLLTKKAFE